MDERFTLEDIYADLDIPDEEFEAILNRSLNPRGSESLLDEMGALGLDAGHLLLDVGCRDGRYGIELAKRHGCRVLGIDPVADHVAKAQTLIAETQQGVQVQVVSGVVEKIPADDESVDYIWCRDMLNHVADLNLAFQECFRVLVSGGQMLIYQTLATNLLEPSEAAQLYPPLVVVPQNMDPTYVEAAWSAAGFRTIKRDPIGSEWREQWEEDGTRFTSKQLLTIARMHRSRDNLIAEIGEKHYAVELANCYWGVYQMLGKLCPTVYVIQKLEDDKPIA